MGVNNGRKLLHLYLKKSEIDLLICAHIHRYSSHDPTATHPYPTIIGGSPTAGERTLIKETADQKNLNLRMLRDDGLR